MQVQQIDQIVAHGQQMRPCAKVALEPGGRFKGEEQPGLKPGDGLGGIDTKRRSQVFRF